jgi:hypothetical protein
MTKKLTKMQTKTAFVKIEWLTILLQKTRKVLVLDKIKSEDAFGMGFAAFCGKFETRLGRAPVGSSGFSSPTSDSS